jgi:peptide/nickel transport system permease protein/dipeptide transport system permease protein
VKRYPFSLSIVIFFCLAGIFAPWLAPFDPTAVFDGKGLLSPSASGFLLGTDDLGRDVLSRLLYGARVSMGLGFLVVVLSLVFGGSLGLLAGFFGGRIESTINRFVDILMSLPSLLLAVVVVAVVGPGLWTAVWAVVVVSLPGYIRVVRAAVINEKEKEYVTAARSFGATRFHLMVRTILPNCIAPLIVQSTLGFSDGILNMAALGFLGLGAQAPTPEWGVMLGDSRAFIESAWWLVTLPGLCLLIVVLGFNLLGDGLRDHLDPKLRKP